MSVNGWLLSVAFAALAFLFFCLFLLLGRNKTQTAVSRSLLEDFFPRWKRKQALRSFYLQSYVQFLRLPGLQGYTLKIRRRLETIHSYDEYTMRKETMRIAFVTLGITSGIILALALISRDILFMLWVVLGALMLNGLLIDIFVNRMEDRLLKQFGHYLGDVRHDYQQHRMVDEAIYEAAQAAPHEAQMHAERIHGILTSSNPAVKLERYYDVAPNRYLKAFAGISHLILEYGDRVIHKGSMYLNAVSKLVQEMNFDLLRREKLNYLLKGLTAIAVAPIFFTVPLERWARAYFPAIQQFYDGKIGIVTKICVYAVIILAYVLIRKMLENDDGRYIAKAPRPMWEKKICDLQPIRGIIGRFVPDPHTKEHFRLTLLLKEANSRLKLEWVTLHRLILGLILFISGLFLVLYMHSYSAKQILYAPTTHHVLFGALSGDELQKAREISDFDRTIMEEVKKGEERTHETIVQRIKERSEQPLDTVAVNVTAMRILDKLDKLENEFLRWWELLLAIAAGVVGYYIPLAILRFQRRMRAMDMQNEVEQFHTLILILSEFERVSVEQVLEWMERFAIIFKPALQQCLLNYDSGAAAALEQLKQEAPFVPFVRIVERLQNAVEKIPIKEAFDDLEMEQEYYKEKKKEHYERVISQKASWGKLIGFAPMYVLVFMYLVLPLLYMSVVQMDDFVNQIQRV